MSKVTAKYQITIPPEVRKDLGIIPGTNVDITRKGDRYVLIVNPINELKRRWRGRFKDGKTTTEYMDEIRGKVG
ncbi:MAG: AbrB/MazE/SpoVT family DNA-binding domain-containing protein [Nitrospinae bacterium]|nr:AbrB/MazE/SpoVT family DNA-binding domain-containing protein [Nitrospinota bacterium]